MAGKRIKRRKRKPVIGSGKIRRRTKWERIIAQSKGRTPDFLNPQIRRKVLEGISLGLPYYRVADFAGINENTLRRWVKYGQERKSPLYITMYMEIRKAQVKAEKSHLKNISDVALGGQKIVKTKKVFMGKTKGRKTKGLGPPDKIRKGKLVDLTIMEETSSPEWKASAWYLERRYPERYGKQEKPENNEVLVLAQMMLGLDMADMEKVRRVVQDAANKKKKD